MIERGGWGGARPIVPMVVIGYVPEQFSRLRAADCLTRHELALGSRTCV